VDECQVKEIEENHHTPRQGISEIYFTAFSKDLPILPQLLCLFYPGSGQIWGVKRQLSRN
jgi:hypothetical protein